MNNLLRLPIAAFLAIVLGVGQSTADTFTDFEPNGFVPSDTVNDLQPDGTTIAPPMAFNDSCREAWFVPTVFRPALGITDEEIVDLGADPHGKVWRLAPVPSGVVDNDGNPDELSGGQQPHSPRNPDDISGEAANLPNDACGPSTSTSFYAEFEFTSATGGAQPGLHMAVAANSGDTRQAFVRIQDNGSGFDIGYFGTADGCSFPLAEVATGLSTDEWHRIGIEIEFVDGLAAGTVGNVGAEGNDIVKIYVDNVLRHTGTTWESCVGARVVDQLLFELRDHDEAFAGNGLYFDNVLVGTQCPPGNCNLPQVVDHFKCYRVVSRGTSKLESGPIVDLEDQFGEELGVRVDDKARVFCNPVVKNQEGELEDLGDQHLTCYDIKGDREEHLVDISNQFGDQTLRLLHAELLCVPSEKLGFEKIERGRGDGDGEED